MPTWTPAVDSACAHRHRVNGDVSNAAATCTWVPALIRITDTAASRRPINPCGIWSTMNVGKIASGTGNGRPA